MFKRSRFPPPNQQRRTGKNSNSVQLCHSSDLRFATVWVYTNKPSPRKSKNSIRCRPDIQVTVGSSLEEKSKQYQDGLAVVRTRNSVKDKPLTDPPGPNWILWPDDLDEM